MNHAPRLHRGTWLSKLLWLPIIVLIVTVVAQANYLRQRVSSRKLDLQQIANTDSVRSSQEFLRAQYELTAHREGTEAWQEILTAALAMPQEMALDTRNRVASDRVLPWVDQSASLPPKRLPKEARGSGWDSDLIGRYLEVLSPVIVAIEEASENPTPVWLPDQANGTTSTNDLPNRLANYLRLEIEHALVMKQPEFAMRAIRAMRQLIKAVDWEYSLGIYRLMHLYHDGIRHSFEADVWNEEQLRELSAELSDAFAPESRWDAIQRLQVLAELELYDDLSGAQPIRFGGAYDQTAGSMYFGKLRTYEEASSDFLRFVDTEAVDRRQTQYDAVSMQYFWISQLMQIEQQKQLLLAACGVKLYQRMNGTWPDSLGQLEEVGIHLHEIQQGSGTLPRYEQNPEGATISGRRLPALFNQYTDFEDVIIR